MLLLIPELNIVEEDVMNDHKSKLLKRFYNNKLGVLGAILVLIVIFLAIFAPVISPYSPEEMNILYKRQAPQKDFIFGTDKFGRDIFSRIIYGSRVSLTVGIISVGIGVFFGIILGLYSGYTGNIFDSIIMWFMDMLMSFPSILLALVVITVLGSSIINTMIAIGITYIPTFTRIVRGSVMEVRDQEFVEAARVVGAKDFKILFKHILPNVTAPIIVQATLALSGAILTEATLSFLGLGVQPPMPSWGSMLSDSRSYMELAPWTVIFPSIAIMFSVLGFNILGDGLRDVLDPKLQ
jgi:ABC-type dipeptide/oligopeptide/nickel transport system permease subunit